MTAGRLGVDSAEIMTELDALARLSDAPFPAVTRVVYTPADLAARAFIKKRCNDAGLSVREDAIGNTFARWEGQEATLAPVGTGSHIDAIPHSGRFDGTVGVIGGLAAIRALKRAGFRTGAADRAPDLYQRRTDAIRDGMPGEPHVGRLVVARVAARA